MKLPSSIYSLDQLTGIAWEIEENLSELRSHPRSKPQFSTEAEELLALNNFHEFTEATGKVIQEKLETLREASQEVHISTGSATSTKWREEMVRWLRKEIDSALFCSFSIDTSQGGGIILRTPKHEYDMTFKRRIMSNTNRLVELMK